MNDQAPKRFPWRIFFPELNYKKKFFLPSEGREKGWVERAERLSKKT
jgi:hypothetical protein